MVAILFVASLYAAYQPKLLISRIVILGNKTVSEYEIRHVINKELIGKYWRLYPKNNALLFPRDQMLQSLALTFPRLSSIKLEQPDLHSLNLSVTERHGEFLWCLPGAVTGLPTSDCYFADKTGFVFAPAPRFSNPLYFEFLSANNMELIGKYPLPEADLRKLITGEKQISAILADSNLADSKAYRASPAELRDWYFQVKSGTSAAKTWEIRLDLDQDFDVAMKTLASALVNPEFLKDWQTHQSNLEYIDLRFAPKVFYRYNTE